MESYKSSENYKALKEILGEGLEEEVEKVVQAHYGLIPKSSAVNLLAAVHGVFKQPRYSPSKIPPGMRNFDTSGIVTKIYPAYEPNNASKSSPSVRLLLEDEVAKKEVTVVLWDEHSQLVKGKIGIGDRVEISHAYFRSGEINIGSSGSVNVVEKAKSVKIGDISYGLVNIEGKVTEIFPEYYYMKFGRELFSCGFKLTQSEGSVRVVVWHEPQQAKKLNLGDLVMCENCLYKNNEIHVNAYSRMVVLKSALPECDKGEVKSIEERNGEIFAHIGKKEVRFFGPDALSFLGIGTLPSGVGLATVVKIKAGGIVGAKAKFKIIEESKDRGNLASFLGFEREGAESEK